MNLHIDCVQCRGRARVLLLSLRIANMNNMPGSVVVSIDIAASTETNHVMTIGIDLIKKTLRKRRTHT